MTARDDRRRMLETLAMEALAHEAARDWRAAADTRLVLADAFDELGYADRARRERCQAHAALIWLWMNAHHPHTRVVNIVPIRRSTKLECRSFEVLVPFHHDEVGHVMVSFDRRGIRLAVHPFTIRRGRHRPAVW